MPPRAASPRDPIPKKTEVLAVSADKGGPSFLDRMSPFEVRSVYAYVMHRLRRAVASSARTLFSPAPLSAGWLD